MSQLVTIAAGLAHLRKERRQREVGGAKRHTAGRVIPARRATSATSNRSAECRMIRARAACFCGRLRPAAIAARRARSPGETKGQTVYAMH
jgi:hypothetical protein